MTETNQPSTPVNDGKTAAIISYITLIGWIIAFVMHNGNKTSLSAFHLRQSGILILAYFVLSIFYSILLFSGIPGIALIISLLILGVFVLTIIGIIAAVNGQEKKIPFLGDMGQNLFAGLK